MKAIAAMSSNRAIGLRGNIPWESCLREDFKWFRRATMGNILIMGRKTVESLPKALDGRTIITLSGKKSVQEILEDIMLIEETQKEGEGKEVWLCGGAQIYNMLLPYCTHLYLTTVFKEYRGDVFFPDHRIWFDKEETLYHDSQYCIEKYINRKLLNN